MDKREEVNSILTSLKDVDIGKNEPHTISLLQRLKVLGRQVQDADAIFTSDGIKTIFRCGFYRIDVNISREALGCLANATLLRPDTRQIIVDLGNAPSLASLYSNALKAPEAEDEFLCGRLLLMLTDKTNLDYTSLLRDNGLAEAINKAIQNHAQSSVPFDSSDRLGGPSREMALSETLKLLYSMLTYYPAMSTQFKSAISPIVSILMKKRSEPVRPLDAPINHLINALFKFDRIATDEAIIPRTEQSSFSKVLIDILSKTIDAYPASALDVAAAPILGLLGEMYKSAPEDVKNGIKRSLLPSDEERDKPLGQANTLSAKLLRLSTSSYTPELRNVIPTVLFELSDGDAEVFVKNVGYGFASGFLTNMQIPNPPPPKAKSGSTASSDDINYVTGQYLAQEPKSTEPPMSEEEKMREAERLFVLFERLKKTGVMDVKNPVEDAIQSGRFEELD